MSGDVARERTRGRPGRPHGVHVLILPSWYPDELNPVSGSFFYEQARGLQRASARVGVLAMSSASLRALWVYLRGPRGMRIEDYGGIPTLRQTVLRVFPMIPGANKKLSVLMGLRAFRRYVREFGRPDVLHVHCVLEAGFLAEAISRKYLIPYVVTEHSTAYARNRIPRDEVPDMTRVVRGASALVAVSEPFRALLDGFYAATLRTWQYIPNMVRQEFLDRPIAPRKSAGGFRFVCVAFLVEKKWIEGLIDAFTLAFAAHPDVELVIGGDGPLREKLQDLAHQTGLGPRIAFLGALGRSDVVETIARADAVVLPSAVETFGVVVIEALALGKPVVATRSGGPESILEERDGVVVERQNVEALAKGMMHLYERKRDYDAEEIRQRCAERFRESTVAGKLIAVYRSVLRVDAALAPDDVRTLTGQGAGIVGSRGLLADATPP